MESYHVVTFELRRPETGFGLACRLPCGLEGAVFYPHVVKMGNASRGAEVGFAQHRGMTRASRMACLTERSVCL